MKYCHGALKFGWKNNAVSDDNCNIVDILVRACVVPAICAHAYQHITLYNSGARWGDNTNIINNVRFTASVGDATYMGGLRSRYVGVIWFISHCSPTSTDHVYTTHILLH